MKGYGRAVRKILIEAGCRFLRQGRGYHEIWISPHANKPFTVPVSIASRHTAEQSIEGCWLAEGILSSDMSSERIASQLMNSSCR